MDITLPSSFEALKSFEFSERFDEICSSGDSLAFTFPINVNAQPAGLLLMGSTLRRIRNTREVSFNNISDNSYLGNMGFYQSIKENRGKQVDQLRGNTRFIPIRRRDLLEENRIEFYNNIGSGNVYDLIEKVSEEITQVLLNADKSLYDICYYSLFEIIRNVLEHSTSSVIWYTGQYWPTKKKVEIAILDEGCGILSSFMKSSDYVHINSDIEAINEAIKEGVTTVKRKPTGLNDNENTGYGLFKIKSLCELAGELTICSGKSSIVYKNNSEKYYTSDHVGTMISMTLEYNKIRKNSLEIAQILHPRRNSNDK